jgi:sarcosine oxidase
MRRADVVVVGAGAMGSSAAWWLARRGRDVVLIERFEQGHVRGSSHGGTRIFRLAYVNPDYVRLAQEALPLWRELEDDAGEVLLEQTGGVDHGHPAAVADIERALHAAGVTCARLSPDQAAERWPGMRFDGDALVQPDAGRAHAGRTVAALQRRAAAHGAEVRFEEQVVAIEGDRVRTTHDEYVAGTVVVAAGAWAPGLVAELLPPLRVSREQIFHFASDTDDWPSFIHYRDPAIYGLFTPGQGVKVAEHHTGHDTSPEPDVRSFDIDPEGQARVEAYVAEWFPGLAPQPASAETCLYTTTPDEHFVLDRRGPTVVASPCSGHGFKFTPVIGRMVADLADGASLSWRPRPGAVR